LNCEQKEMTEDFANRLRSEIWEAQKRRHDLLMRKLAFTTGLLGVGSLGIVVGSKQQINLTLLLYLVPFVAIAYDFYIVDEGYGIKRAGQFLGRDDSGASESERKWEKFVQRHRNRLSPVAHYIVTMTLIAGAFVSLLQSASSKLVLFIWLALVALVEAMLAAYSLWLGRRLLR
jgi:hypothetical protein